MMKSVSTALLAGVIACSFSQSVPAAESAKYKKEKVLHVFGSGGDGNAAYDVPIDVNGILYGTTTLGGANNQGAVYSFDPKTGTERVLYSFCGPNCADGETPVGPLLDVNGMLYGTTAYAGAYNEGAVFVIDPATGAETLLHSFARSGDGEEPQGGLIDLNGTLYGTTAYGQSGVAGTIFAIDPATGAEKVVYGFTGGTDGANPRDTLIAVNGKLYGTTSSGGVNNNGTVFALDPKTGKEKVLHSFAGGTGDGASPGFAGLVYAKGILYGTTDDGGAYCYENGGIGCGTVFSVDLKTGAEKVLYSFSAADGSPAGAGVITVKGMLYGTLLDGGSMNCEYGCGSVYSLDPTTGAERVVYSFQGGADGSYPRGGVTRIGGKLYGTTSGQGLGTQSTGTLYVLTK